MTAAHGIIHSEMPEQVEGAMRGFQLWVNLPAKSKLAPAGYRDIEPEDVPRLETAGGVKVTVIAGRFDDGQAQQIGAVEGRTPSRTTTTCNCLPAAASPRACRTAIACCCTSTKAA